MLLLHLYLPVKIVWNPSCSKPIGVLSAWALSWCSLWTTNFRVQPQPNSSPPANVILISQWLVPGWKYSTAGSELVPLLNLINTVLSVKSIAPAGLSAFASATFGANCPGFFVTWNHCTEFLNTTVLSTVYADGVRSSKIITFPHLIALIQ